MLLFSLASFVSQCQSGLGCHPFATRSLSSYCVYYYIHIVLQILHSFHHLSHPKKTLCTHKCAAVPMKTVRKASVRFGAKLAPLPCRDSQQLKTKRTSLQLVPSEESSPFSNPIHFVTTICRETASRLSLSLADSGPSPSLSSPTSS